MSRAIILKYNKRTSFKWNYLLFLLYFSKMCYDNIKKEHRNEIDARGETFQEFEDFGNELIRNNHYEGENIKNRLFEMQELRDDLERAWKARQDKLDQCLELQLFNRDCETAEQWMKSRENALKDDGQHPDSVEAAIKRHEGMNNNFHLKNFYFKMNIFNRNKLF